ncbi:MAG TPA: glycosyltransferase [Chloroflexi bacterium]|nr:glycosyltransferase [Betaproteobacteria bacterium]HAH14995.1 glycosyltransferase [Chloroflexota bacterium]
MTISVTIPVYNEEQNLSRLCAELIPTLESLRQPWEVVLVNDGSTDGSAAVLDKLAADDPRLKVIHFRRNAGQTAAMMAGFEYARGDIIVPMDADLQNDPQDIPRLLEKLDEGYDVCSGWRQDRQDHALRRNFPSRVANWLISKVSGVRLHDYGCSLKAYRREVIKGVRLYGEMHRFIPIYANWLGAKVTEVPVRHRPRVAGHSSYGLERIFKVLLDLVVVKFLDRYAQKPIYVFGGFGLLNFAVSLAAGLWAVYLKYGAGISFIQTPLPLLVVMSAITGVICVLLGLVAEMVTRNWHESHDKRTYIVGATRNLESGSISAGAD